MSLSKSSAGPALPRVRHQSPPGSLCDQADGLRAHVDGFARLPGVVQLQQAPHIMRRLVDVIEAIAERIEGQNHA